MMKAALVTAFDHAPQYTEVDAPVVPTGSVEPSEQRADHAAGMLIHVEAAGLHPRVRSQADGSHYTSTDELPLIPGIDGVGRGADGLLRYFILPDTTFGSMAEQVLIDPRRSVVLTEPARTNTTDVAADTGAGPAAADTDADAVAVAAAMNPAMSSWVALRRRIEFRAGQSVLVLGATGNAGRMAVEVARLFGAGEIIAAGRNEARLAELPALGATELVPLGGDPDETSRRLGAAAADIDVVIDYTWGAPTASAMIAVVTARADRGKPLTWIEIGSMAGPTAEIPSAALRAARLQIVGSGQGSVSAREILAELPELAQAITGGAFQIDVRAVPLADVEQTWTASAASGERIVFTP